MRVSVVIPTLNGGDKLIECVKSVKAQRFDKNYELVIIDSGSDDNSIEEIKSIFSKSKILCKIIIIDKRDFKHGRTRNHAIENCSGEIILLLTQDAIPTNENWIANLEKPFSQGSNVAGVFGKHDAYENHPVLIHRNLRRHFRFMETLPERFINNFKEYEEKKSKRQLMHFFSNNNSAIRKSTWYEIPFPDVDYGEDQAWADKILLKGYKIVYTPKAVVYHSHFYNFIGIYRRSLTEISYFRKHFDYNLTQNPSLFFPRLFKTICNDIRWLFKNNKLSVKEIYYSCYSNLAENLARTWSVLRLR